MTWDDLMTAARQGRGVMRFARPVWRKMLGFRVPVFRPLAALLYAERHAQAIVLPLVAQKFYREPLLRYRCAHVGERLHLEGAMPQIFGDGRIELGDDVLIGSRCTWVVGFKVSQGAELIVGDRVSLNFQNMISVARSVRIGDDTMVAGGVQIYDNISHPLSPSRRLRHDSFTLEESAPVVIGKNVWLGTRSIIMRGVTIGDHSVVAAGSIVTRDVPPYTLAGGSPAKVLKEIEPD